MKTLHSFLRLGVIGGSIVMFFLIYLLFSSIYKGHIKDEAIETSRGLAQSISTSLLQIMRKGYTHTDVREVLEANKGISEDIKREIKLYRSQLLQGQPIMDEELKGVFNEAQEKVIKKDNVIRYLYPLKASIECLACHRDAKVGDVLGVIDEKADITQRMKKIDRQIKLALLAIFPIPLIAGFLIWKVLERRIRLPLELLHKRVEGINRVNDLRNLEVGDINFRFTEFNDLFMELRNLTKRLRSIAVDKDVLEFEVRLLERFVITSEVVRDWKDHIKQLLIEINTIMDCCCIFSLFVVDTESHDLEVFWRNTPSEETKKIYEKIMKGKLAMAPFLRDIDSLNVIHNIALPLYSMPELREEDIEFQTKTLLLETPRVGGIVGVGVSSSLAEDVTRALVIEGILTTLLNVIGSVKAIYKYTKDLEYYATRDPLTQLYNQRMFWELVDYEISRAQRHDYKFSLLMIDIDNFKGINDTYGHAFGDKFLVELSNEIKKVLRHGDILSRYGGDEFVVILPETDKEHAYFVAQRIKNYIEHFSLYTKDGSRARATVSIGLSVFPEHAENPNDLFLFADNMMYKAKAEGRNRIILPTEEDMAEVFQKLGKMSAILMSAIEEKAVIPYFQPILNIKTGEIESYEVLSRIRTEEGIKAASEFIEIAEKSNTISTLDYILMERAFEMAKKVGYEGYLFFNISPKALILKEFIPNISRLVRAYRMEQSKIVFELTERETVKNIALLERFVHDLKYEGYKFAIDDFGSGFATFHYVRRFPIDFIKIEGEFIRGMSTDDKDVSFVKTMSLFARDLNIKSIAEHVESEEILKTVRGLDIDFAQGYYVGEPSAELHI